ncbi:MAG: hypothetical protein ABWX74_02850 [Aeromicrobium sp.]
MWFVIAVIALAVVAAVLLRRRRAGRRAGPALSELSREDQVQAMRNREAGPTHSGSREGAKGRASGGLGERLGPWGP